MIEKIEQMEETLNRCRAAVDRLHSALDAFRQVQPDLALLEAYYGSSEWFSHLAAAESAGIAVSEQEFHCAASWIFINKGLPTDDDFARAAAFAKALAE